MKKLLLVLIVFLGMVTPSFCLDQKDGACITLITSGIYIDYMAYKLENEYGGSDAIDNLYVLGTTNILTGTCILLYDRYGNPDSGIEIDSLNVLDTTIMTIKFNF